MNDKSTVYLETTIPSFLTSRPSNNLVIAGKQEVTRQWWEKRREKYYLEENIMNDPIVTEVRKQRMKILESYEGDFRKMSRDVMKRQFESGHKVVSFGKRIPQQGTAPNAYPLRGQA